MIRRVLSLVFAASVAGGCSSVLGIQSVTEDGGAPDGGTTSSSSATGKKDAGASSSAHGTSGSASGTSSSSSTSVTSSTIGTSTSSTSAGDGGSDASSTASSSTSSMSSTSSSSSSSSNSASSSSSSAPPCVVGDYCAVSNPCAAGTVTACSDGTPTCVSLGASGALQDGTPCGMDEVCHAGMCVGCTSGATCSPSAGTGTPDPCSTWETSCATGAETCVQVTSTANNGMACGLNTGTCTNGICTCAGGAYNPATGTCQTCPTPQNSIVSYVNAGTGVDNACCGGSSTPGFGGPCLTVTYDQSRVVSTPNAVIYVSGDTNGNMSPLESYPIALSNGQALAAGPTGGEPCFPGVPGQPIISVATDTSSCGIGRNAPGSGTYGGPIALGSCPGAATKGLPKAGVFVGTNAAGTAQAHFDGGEGDISGVVYGVLVDGGNVTSVNASEFNVKSAQIDGVHVESTNMNGVPSSYSIQTHVVGALRYDIFLGQGSTTLPSGQIQLGPNGSTMRGPCTSYDNVGIHMEGNATATFAYPGDTQIFCMRGNGIELMLAATGTGTPSLVNAESQIEYCGCAAVDVEAGKYTSFGSTYTNDYWGIVAGPSAGAISLQADPSADTFGCFTDQEPGMCQTKGMGPGFGIWNQSGATINASNDTWSTSPPTSCSCPTGTTGCTCVGVAGTTPPDGTLIVNSGTTSSTTTTGTMASTSTFTCP